MKTFVFCLLLGQVSIKAFAVPPLVAGDVPTADKKHIEWYIGTQYKKTGDIEREIPFTELVYGVSNRHEITLETSYSSIEGQHGLGDITLGTKYQLDVETENSPGIAGVVEVKMANGNEVKGLGSGAKEYNFMCRLQKNLGRFTWFGNLGYTFLEVTTENKEKNNVIFAAMAQEYRINTKTSLLSDVYWNNADEPGNPSRVAADIGIKRHLLPSLDVHASMGKSLRRNDLGGPKLRIYTGVKLEFGI